MPQYLVQFKLVWQSPLAAHTERFLNLISSGGDTLPQALARTLAGDPPECAADAELPVIAVRPELFLAVDPARAVVPLRHQRHYPPAALRGVTAPPGAAVFRYADGLADFNHPLAGRALHLHWQAERVQAPPPPARGWQDWLGVGPGMQAQAGEADFFFDGAFARQDEASDDAFYATPRPVQHVDDWARSRIAELHARLLPPDARVLDLMSSWVTHLPDDYRPAGLSGLGMNAAELDQNPRLSERCVHDLNATPALPYSDGAFDAVLCALSVDYLTRPVEVFREVGRVLRPGGVFVVSFSNRCFPTKAVAVWRDAHDFERLGLVMRYFLESGRFTTLETLSARGWPRPKTDRLYPQLRQADPLYAVWAHCLG